MALQNIGASNRDDAFYRYKMPKLVTKIEGRGNGIKTNLVNMVDVAKALARLPSYTTKYFGCELGAQSKYDEKTGTCIVNGAHDTAKLAGLLENFIKKYVQCYGCGNPETEIVITKTQLITLKCAACGFVSDVDMRDKLTTFILKNPPEQKKGAKERKGIRRAEKERLKEGEAVDEEAKKVKKEPKKKKGHEDSAKASRKKASGSDEEEQSPTSSQVDEDEEGTPDDDGVQWQTDTSVEAAQKRIKEQLTTATSEMVMLDSNGTDESVVKDMGAKKESKAATKKTVTKNHEVGENKVPEADLKKFRELSLHDRLLEELKGCLKGGFTAIQLASHLQTMEGSKQEIMNAYFEVLSDGVCRGLAKEVGKKKLYLAKAIQNEISQNLLLGAIETYCGSSYPDAGKEVSLVLKLLYDAEILEEDLILGWYDKGAASGIYSKTGNLWMSAKPFVEWLRNAEAESEEE